MAAAGNTSKLKVYNDEKKNILHKCLVKPKGIKHGFCKGINNYTNKQWKSEDLLFPYVDAK